MCVKKVMGAVLLGPTAAWPKRTEAAMSKKGKEKEKEGALPVRGLNILEADSWSAASPATPTW